MSTLVGFGIKAGCGLLFFKPPSLTLLVSLPIIDCYSQYANLQKSALLLVEVGVITDIRRNQYGSAKCKKLPKFELGAKRYNDTGLYHWDGCNFPGRQRC